MMTEFLLKYKWKIAGLIIGAIAGFSYWYFIGCASGTCPIQSHWQQSTFYGGLIGYILPKGPKKNSAKKESDKPEENASN